MEERLGEGNSKIKSKPPQGTNMELSDKDQTIGGVSSQIGGDTTSGSAVVSRGATRGLHQANLEGVSGPRADSGSKAAGTTLSNPWVASSPDATCQTMRNFPQLADPSYLKDKEIDTWKLGTEKLGKNMGSGPIKQKFRCSKCRAKRWILDSVAGSAAELHRFSICSFCELRDQFTKERTEEARAYKLELTKLQELMEQRLANFERRIEEAERGIKDGGRGGVQQETGSPLKLRGDFEALRTQLTGEVNDLKSRLEVEPRRKEGVTEKVGGSNNDDSLANAEKELMSLLSDMVQSQTQGKEATTTTRRKRQRKRRKKRKKKKKGNGSALKGDEALTLLLGDSMVGGDTKVIFSRMSSTFRSVAHPGAGVRKITFEVRKMESAPQNTLVLSVGGNDFFGKGRRVGDANALMVDYGTLLGEAKAKTSKCIVVGLLPRMYWHYSDYEKARETNQRIGSLCRAKGLRFVDPWIHFFGKDRFFRKDGIHFSTEGATVFARIIRANLFAPQVRNTKEVTKKKKKEGKKGTGAPRTVELINISDVVPTQVLNSSGMSIGGILTPARMGPQKRQRSPEEEEEARTKQTVEARQSPLLKRRRASEGETPSPDSRPVRSGEPPSPIPTGNLETPG